MEDSNFHEDNEKCTDYNTANLQQGDTCCQHNTDNQESEVNLNVYNNKKHQYTIEDSEEHPQFLMNIDFKDTQDMRIETTEELEKQIHEIITTKLLEMRTEPHDFEINSTFADIKGSEWIINTASQISVMNDTKYSIKEKLNNTGEDFSIERITKYFHKDAENNYCSVNIKDSEIYNTDDNLENTITNFEIMNQKSGIKSDTNESMTITTITANFDEQYNLYPQLHSRDTVTVKFVLKETDETLTRAFNSQSNILELKQCLSSLLCLPPENIYLAQSDIELPNDLQLFETGVETYGTVEMNVTTGRKHGDIEWMCHNLYSVPDVITVATGKGAVGELVKEIVVEIENQCRIKPFLGGYRNKVTGKEYHHAESQTQCQPRGILPQKFNVATQTVHLRMNGVNTVKNVGIQFNRCEYLIPNKHDKIIIPERYPKTTELGNILREKAEAKVLTIQRYVRGWLARKKYEKERKTLKKMENEEENNALLENIVEEYSQQKRSFPKTRADFDILYSLVERWRQSQVNHIKAMKTDASKKALFCSLLEKEIKLLCSIEKYKIQLKSEVQEKRELQILEENAKPKTWNSYNGLKVSMETISTQRAKELKELYLTICNKDVTLEERVELLISLKYALKKYKSPLVSAISNLLDQECNFLVRGLTSKELDMLRRRTKQMFLDLIKDPMFNSQTM